MVHVFLFHVFIIRLEDRDWLMSLADFDVFGPCLNASEGIQTSHAEANSTILTWNLRWKKFGHVFDKTLMLLPVIVGGDEEVQCSHVHRNLISVGKSHHQNNQGYWKFNPREIQLIHLIFQVRFSEGLTERGWGVWECTIESILHLHSWRSSLRSQQSQT